MENFLASLSQAAINDLESSGLTPATIEEMGVRPTSDTSCANFPKISKDTQDGYLIPYFKTSVPFAQRKNIPSLKKDDGSLQKYSFPYDMGSHLYVLPHDWATIKSPKSAVIITEGEKVTAKISQEVRKLTTDHQKFSAVGIAGVWNFVSCPECKKIRWKNKRIYLAFDVDVEFNSQSILGIFRAIGFLIANHVHIPMLMSLEWDLSIGKGLDDYLVNQRKPYHDRVLEDLIDSARSPFDVYQDKLTIESGVEQIIKGADALLTRSQIESLVPYLKHTFPGYSQNAIRAEVKKCIATHAPSPEGEFTIYLGRREQIKEHAYPEPVAVIAENAWEMIRKKDNQTRFFIRDGEPIYVEKGLPRIMTARHLQSVCDEMIGWVMKTGDAVGETQRRAVPSDIPNHMYHASAVKSLPLPVLEAIVHAPYFGKNRKLHSQPGYSKANNILYYQNGHVFTLPKIPEHPNNEDITTAKTWIQEVLQDFPFVNYDNNNPWNNPEKAHAVALMVEPFIRSWFPVTPLYLVEASTEGTGKGLLADACLRPALGKDPMKATEPSREEEWDKRITALLSDLPSVVYFDNITRELRSGSLNKALTSSYDHGRKLQTSETTTYPNRSTWVATGNNPRVNREMVRRVIRVRLEASCENPSERTGFSHVPLLSWMDKHRGELVWSCLTLVQNYINKGEPSPQTPVSVGSFEEWSRHIQGVLECAGIYGFHQNHEELRQMNVGTSDDLKPMVIEWLQIVEPNHDETSQTVHIEPVLAKTLYELLEFDEILPLYGDTDSAKVRRLGTLLGRNKDRIFEVNTEKWKLCGTDPRKTRNRVLWFLELVE